MSDGKCPHCKETIKVRTKKDIFGPESVSAFIITCPGCETILGFLPNPDEIAHLVAQQFASAGITFKGSES